ncbi:replication region DNA-binding N-term [Oceanospirillum multiglobuliferum]|uniref:KfrA N-terminal DNA-binding domain-containing protein n=1 Tax=Oceanospirillum multiglobuliferum TaxID=64969 RepID=A0A1T4PEZ1_9GAMM|nr:DNA-binding protein [Oceanospirillum multiglobuliferum]OPX55578.1 hypothetical protein BTE48_08140 [Oceanospirillum multiglobuliferum]SJZ90124.1 replication region DNA-binding N-term [Oceanospirillum multiglobuliferum]
MARTGITYQDVKTAIDELLAEGMNPTIAGLRERLGTGSFSTISEHLKQWRQEQHDRPSLTSRTPAPDALSGLMQSLWLQAKDEASKELAEYKEKIEQELRNALEEKNQALKAALDTESKNRWLEEKNSQLQTECQSQQHETGRLQAKIEHLKEANSEAKKQLDANKSEYKQQLQDWQDKNASLQQLLAENRLEIQKLAEQFQQQLKEERDRAEQTDQRWLAQLDEARQKIKQLETDWLASQKKQSQQQADQHKQLAIQQEHLHAKLEQHSQKLQQVEEAQIERAKTMQQAVEQSMLKLHQEQQADIQQLEMLFRKASLVGINWQLV